jgi:FkbM family methyltransferase
LNANSPPDQQLEELLSESVSQAVLREQSALDAAAEPFSRAIVLFGAGVIGKKALGALRSLDIEPLAFADNNRAIWGQAVDGVQVLSPDEAAERFGRKAAFVVTVWTPGASCPKVFRQLRDLGCAKVIPFFPLLWKCPQAFGSTYCLDLPHKVLQQRDSVQVGLSLWADEASRSEYLAQVRLRLLGDLDGLPPPCPFDQYFLDDLFRLTDNEMFVDCGAYDGDTLRAFIGRRGAAFAGFLALEPDAANFQKLRESVAALAPDIARKVQLQPCAVGATNGRVRFTAAGTGSAISADGAGEVQCVALDRVAASDLATYIKMDVEGAEADALMGAERLIRDRLPLLAIAAYHKQDDLWRIPLLIRSFSSQYRLFLRPHDAAFELVCYAIPLHRLLPDSIHTARPGSPS